MALSTVLTSRWTPAVALAAWIVWFKVVLVPASHKKLPWGPRWLSSLCVRFSWWWANTVMNMPFKTNEKEAEEKGTLTGQIFIVWHPHGAFCGIPLFFGGVPWFNHSNNVTQWYVCIADLLFRIPILGEYMALNNCRSAAKRTMQGLLAKGHSIGVQPGGIYEQVRWDSDREVIYFPKNLGFIYLAVERGVPLVPLYIFGEGQMFKQNGITRTLNRAINKYTGGGTFFVTGRFGLPWMWPNRTPIAWCYGERVDVGTPDAAPSEERIREIFLRYVKELRKVWDIHAKDSLPAAVAEKGLKIIWRGHEDEVL